VCWGAQRKVWVPLLTLASCRLSHEAHARRVGVFLFAPLSQIPLRIPSLVPGSPFSKSHILASGVCLHTLAETFFTERVPYSVNCWRVALS